MGGCVSQPTKTLCTCATAPQHSSCPLTHSHSTSMFALTVWRPDCDSSRVECASTPVPVLGRLVHQLVKGGEYVVSKLCGVCWKGLRGVCGGGGGLYRGGGGVRRRRRAAASTERTHERSCVAAALSTNMPAAASFIFFGNPHLYLSNGCVALTG